MKINGDIRNGKLAKTYNILRLTGTGGVADAGFADGVGAAPFARHTSLMVDPYFFYGGRCHRI